MFPGDSSTSPDSYNPSSSSSSSLSLGGTLSISPDNVSLYLHPQYHHPLHAHPQQLHASLYDYPRDMVACSSEDAINFSTVDQSIPLVMGAGYPGREQARLPTMQDFQSAPHAMQLQGFPMSSVQARFYNDQILRSVAASHSSGVEPTSAYETQGLLNSMQAHESSSAASREMMQNRTLVSGVHHEAPARYEETCTPRPRWSPTQEQIEILETLFNSGTRTPSRELITEIAAELRKYGTIGEANVFYWFQNRKARAKKKQLQHAASRNPASPSCP